MEQEQVARGVARRKRRIVHDAGEDHPAAHPPGGGEPLKPGPFRTVADDEEARIRAFAKDERGRFDELLNALTSVEPLNRQDKLLTSSNVVAVACVARGPRTEPFRVDSVRNDDERCRGRRGVLPGDDVAHERRDARHGIRTPRCTPHEAAEEPGRTVAGIVDIHPDQRQHRRNAKARRPPLTGDSSRQQIVHVQHIGRQSPQQTA